MRPTTRRGPTRAQVSSVLLAFKAAVLAAVLALTVTTGLAASGGAAAAPDARPPTMAMDHASQAVHRAMSEHNCSSTGFDPGTQPDSALVRTTRGELRIVSFDRGWDVFTGRRPGLLVAVCLARP
ncbi:hypothetical protein [Nocardioides marmotae]|uniref:hypothetical protein n=1 Tax=Nocardioides marmotae TaxID=2663857 RepID=UPI0012B57C7B|nr:hypothetical protein [Nocardioides marmotae]MBC9734266.1 hypothetical protein [Nocardioides marmotae]MTB85367.1 hypothetical protein [Nocardioides marmotae]